MSKRVLPNEEAEWPAVIRAQDETSKYLMKQEKEVKQKSMIRYKEELDKQLLQKHQNQLIEFVDLKEERTYLTQQNEAMKKFEVLKKQADRSFEQHFLKANKNDESAKRKKLFNDLKSERELEKQRILDSLNFENQRKLEENSNRKKIVKEQQRVLDQQLQLRNENFLNKEQEKERERMMIERNIEEMKNREQSYKKFYDKKLANLEQKSKIFQTVLEKDKVNQEFIRKRNEEWEIAVRDKALVKEKQDEVLRRKAVSEMRNELDRQIDEKYQRRVNQAQESLREQEFAKSVAENEKVKRKIEIDEKRKKMNELKFFLEKQLDEKQRNLEQLYMDPVEKKMNLKLLEQVNSNKPVAFIGVPGVHTSESPQKHSFDRVFKSPSRVVEYSQLDLKSEKSNDSFQSVSKSFSVDPEKYKFKGYDLTKHNPIVNPIGSMLPKVLPGQRIVRGGNHRSTFGRNASNIIFNA